MLNAAEDFPRAFVQCFVGQDAAGIAALMTEDGQGQTLSGLWVDGRPAALAAWQAEFSGLLARARLVTGRNTLKMLGPGAAVLHQRFVVTGALTADGTDLPRFPAMLSATLIAQSGGWLALSCSFTAISD